MSGLPLLFKKTSTGKIQSWSISGNRTYGAGTIVTVFGQVGGKLQTTHETISEGKNTGKSNETTAYEQACAEAQSRWTQKKTKNGYVEDIEAAKAGERDVLVKGGIDPMLAHPFSKHGDKIAYPAFLQPKLDGHRCIATVIDGECTLWSRTRKPITSMPHIVAAIEALSGGNDMVLDGELYHHAYRDQFEELTSLIRQEEPAPGHEVVEYHIYDLPSSEGAFRARSRRLEQMCLGLFGPLVPVETTLAENEDEALAAMGAYMAEGYEGAMLRNADVGEYENKRSYNLQKLKEFSDSEFAIIGVEEGRGKLAGHAIFVCKTDQGTEFKAKLVGDTAQLKRYFGTKPSGKANS